MVSVSSPDKNRASERNNVKISGAGKTPMIFAHGYGCDQTMWRFVAPKFEESHQVVLFDHVGAGGSDRAAYHRNRYGSLQGYVDDLIEVCRELDLKKSVFVGHSVSATIGVLAALQAPDHFSRLVLIGPSPCYINDGAYVGGFAREDIDDLLEVLDSNHLGWSSTMAPVIMGNPERPELGEELKNSFCQMDPEIARQFARVTFLSDNRDDFRRTVLPALVLQCSDDAIAPTAVGEFVHQQLPHSRIVYLRATGHCPHLSAPAEVIAAMRGFLAQDAPDA